MLLGLLFVFPLNVSAADGTENVVLTDMQISGFVLDGSTGDGTYADVTDELSISMHNVSSSTFYGYYLVYFPFSDADHYRLSALLSFSEDFNFNSNHEYNIKFSWGSVVNLNTSLTLCLLYYDVNGEMIKEQVLFDQTCMPQQSIQNVDVNFKPDVSGIQSAYTCELVLLFSQTGYNNATYRQGFFISPEIELIDKDDDSGWFQKILNKINDVWESIKALPNQIEASFTAVGDGIVNGIREALQWAFVPSEEYLESFANSWQTWFESHFGVFSQVTNFLVDMIGEFEDLFTGDYAFVFPEVSVPIMDKNIVLIEEQTVDIAQWLEAGSFGARLYEIYTTCVWAIIIYCVMKYALVVQDIIFAGNRMVLNDI